MSSDFIFPKSCYKLPWTETDNPNGWIEPTTYCNLKCPGCFRGCDKETHNPVHLPLTEVKEQIDWFKQHRNVHTISIAGGEPLLYPGIYETIAYAHHLGLRTMMYTNGLLLNEDTLKKLNHAGLTQVVVHIDRFQTRPDINAETSALALRKKMVELLRPFADIKLGFIQPLSADCIDETHEVLEFLEQNIDVVNLMVFTLYRNICWHKGITDVIDDNIDIFKAMEILHTKQPFHPTAYLSTEMKETKPAWVFAQRAGVPGQLLGSFSSAFYTKIHKLYRHKNNRYLFISRKNKISLGRLVQLSWSKSVRSILIKYIKLLFNKKIKFSKELFYQTILLISPPEWHDASRNLCKGCPDRMIYRGKLVPSCILEELKNNDVSAFTNAINTNLLV